MDHSIDILQKRGHYEAYLDGKFVGSYDTVKEAADDIEAMKREADEACLIPA